jgi:hypothetical protein
LPEQFVGGLAEHSLLGQSTDLAPRAFNDTAISRHWF